MSDGCHWNHRVMVALDADTDEAWLSIHEVHYEGDKPVAYTTEPVAVCGDSVEELRTTLQRMLACLDRQTLTPTDFSDGVPEVLPERGDTICNPHPDAPHGFNRSRSLNEDRYVCDCEGWAAHGVGEVPRG